MCVNFVCMSLATVCICVWTYLTAISFALIPFMRLSIRSFADFIYELKCVPCCVSAIDISLVLLVSALMCFAKVSMSSSVAIPKRVRENEPRKGSNERALLDFVIAACGTSRWTVLIML